MCNPRMNPVPEKDSTEKPEKFKQVLSFNDSVSMSISKLL